MNGIIISLRFAGMLFTSVCTSKETTTLSPSSVRDWLLITVCAFIAAENMSINAESIIVFFITVSPYLIM